MRSALALMRVSFLTAASYRLAMFVSVASLVLQIVPTYFIGKTLDPFMAPAIAGQGSDYFGFLVVGTVAYLLLAAAVDALPRALERGISTGTLELIFSTPSSVASLLVGLTGYELLWTLARALVVFAAAAAFGFHAHWARAPEAFVVLSMVVATYFGFGMVAGAMVIAFRRTASLQVIVIVGSALFGGVSYPPSLITTALARYSDAPTWIARIADVVPLTYGLRAVRRLIIDGETARAVLGDVAILAAFCVACLALGSFAFAAALRRARAEGTLSQY
ncbi:MAG TPA: ABC transporter permease [Gemmatimonadaceae bacterium]|nr:ABC transporter permease [Gemmatimonadaceae bacterium]